MNAAWVEAFERDPSAAVSGLFNGTAKGAASRLDTPEFLVQTFADSRLDQRATLDDAVHGWLCHMRDDQLAQVRSLGEGPYGKRVSDALIALQLLELPDTRELIRDSLDDWLRWLRPLRVAPERDPELECWRLISIQQADTRHESNWLRLAVDGRSEYLNVALRGLRSLPNDRDARRNQTLLLQALFQHAVSTYHDHHAAERFFRRRLAALRTAYPRTPQHWNGVLHDVLESNQDDERAVAKELRYVLRPAGAASNSMQTRPSRQQFERLLSDIEDSQQSPTAVTDRFFSLIAEYAADAERTGYSYYFTRSLHNLANRLLARGYLATPSQMTTLRDRVQQALAWEPWNAYCWMLLADWYDCVGDSAMRESVLREMLRLFPDNEPSRVELARLLIERGGDDREEAERWLREAVSLDEEHAYARVELARLLHESGNLAEAEDLLRQVRDRDPDNPVASLYLGRLFASGAERTNRTSEALVQLPSDSHVGGPLAALFARLHRAEHAYSHRHAFAALSEPTGGWRQELLYRCQLGAEFSRDERTTPGAEPAVPLIRAAVRRRDPLAGFYAQWLAIDETIPCPPNAWAWRACQLWQQCAPSDHWDRLTQRFPEAVAETAFLQLLSSGAAAGARRWHDRFDHHNGQRTTPAMSFIRDRVDSVSGTNSETRKTMAFAVLASRALEPPVFTTGHFAGV